MSGTASIGTCVSDQAPSADVPSAASNTNHRRRIEKWMTRLITASSMVVLGFRLAQLGLQNEGIADRDGFAGKQTGKDFDGAIVFASDGDLPGLEAALVAHERDAFAIDHLQCGFWNNDI